MPELPEVETYARSLRKDGGITGKGLINRRIISADLLWQRTLAENTQGETLAQAISGKVIVAVDRRGKYLILRLDEGVILIHLRMSGDLRVESEEEPLRSHDRFIIHFDDGQRLCFNDMRKFGRVWILKDETAQLASLGIEPLSSAFSAEWLANHIRNKNTPVKTRLLDQTLIAGLGNIYSDEALFQARIHPLRRCSGLSDADCERLAFSIQAVLQKGIEANGASFDHVFRGGRFQDDFQVYQRNGLLCFRCGTTIERIIIGQRCSRFCPQCQPLLSD